MRWVILLGIAVLLAVAVIAGATLVARPSASPIPGEIAQLIAALGTPEGQLLEPMAVPFPPAAGTIISHSFFPLAGGHSQLDCLACHVEGIYQGTDATCYACHSDDDPHEGANGTVCSTCHVPNSWQDVSFDHSTIGTQDCAGCHEAPPEHFAPPCAGCHVSTANFQIINFDHSLIGTQDCSACHAPPANHFPAPCATCHVNTANFQEVNFDHSFIGGQDCVACHQPPANHFPGACISCHRDTTNFTNATFNHSFPLNHGDANGQCATCHVNNNTGSYTCTACHDNDEVREEHEKEDIFEFSDCVACHADGDEPDD
jgi:hypothetical protein